MKNVLERGKGTDIVIFAANSDYMRTLSVVLFLSFLFSCQSNSPAKKHEIASEHIEKTVFVSDSSVQQISSFIKTYEELRDAFIAYDHTSVMNKAAELASALDRFTISGLSDTSKLTTVVSATSNMFMAAKNISGNASLDEKKKSFSVLSNAFYLLLSTVQYDQSTVFKQTCPMAFNDNEAASWLSLSSEINNPYLGTKHPKYAAGMLHCGEVTDSVAFK